MGMGGEMEFGEDKSESEVEKLGRGMAGGKVMGIEGGDCDGGMGTEDLSVLSEL